MSKPRHTASRGRLLYAHSRKKRNFPWGAKQIAPSGGDADMAHRSVHEMDRRAAIGRLRSVGMPQPMRRHRQLQAGAGR